MFKNYSCLLTALICSVLFLSQPASGAGLTIHPGAQIKLNSATLDMNCTGITIEDTGVLDLGTGTVTEVWDISIQGAGQLTGPLSSVEYCDWDMDGLPDSVEANSCTSFDDADFDDDGLLDGDEDINHNGIQDPGETSPCSVDSDSDGIQDGTELGLVIDDIWPDTDISVFIADADPSTITDPLDTDTDNDGIADGAEDKNFNGALDPGETDASKEDFPWELFYPAFIKKTQ